MTGFYLMHRGWMDHPLFPREPLCRRAAWVWLIEQACWRDHRINIKGRAVTLKRGQLSYSTRFLAEAWNWSEARVRRFLARLERDGAIDAVTDAGQTVITIRHYSKYQFGPQDPDAPHDAAHDAAATQQRRKEEGRERRERS